MTGWVGLIVIETTCMKLCVRVDVCMDCDFRKLAKTCQLLLPQII